jgi:hypothetical protein
MSRTKLILPKRPLEDTTSSGDSSMGFFGKPILPPPMEEEDCNSSFQVLQEQAAKRQQDSLRAIYTNLHGVQGCVFNPRFETSIYDSEDQDYHYPIVPDFEGKLMIDGIADTIRFAGEDQWSMPEVTLYWSQPNIFDIKENSKIVVNHLDQKISFRSKNKRRQVGQHVEMVQVHQLVPFN